MIHRRIMEQCLERYGETVSTGDAEVNALIRPMQYKSGAALNLPDEYCDRFHYLYTGPAGTELKTGDKVSTSSRDYMVLRSEAFHVGGEDVYTWAVLRALSPDADTEIHLEADGVKVAVADSYTVETVQDNHTVDAWGEREPVGISAGVLRCEVLLQNVRPVDGADLETLAGFHLVLARPGSKTVYTGCEWKNVGASGGVGSLCRRSMRVTALRREEQKGATDNG